MSWKEYTLGEVSSNIQTGPFGSQLHQSDYSEQGIPVVMPKDLIEGHISEVSIARVDQEHVERLSRHKIEVGDILYSRRGDVGRCAYAGVKEEGWLCGTGCLRVSVNPNIANPKYVFYQLQKTETIGWVINHAVGATMLNLNTSILSSVPIELPELDVQNHTVDILSVYDNLIENNQKQIRLLEEAAQRLYKEWFMDLHFPGCENVNVVDGVPEGWEKRSILENDVFKFVKNPVEPFDGEKRYYATADVNSTQLVGHGELITYLKKPSRASVQPVKNSVWFARMSNSYKILNCFGVSNDLADNTIISSGFAGFTSSEELYGFVYETISSKWFDDEKNLYATGATQVSLTNEGLKRIEVLLPSMDLLAKYSQIVMQYMRKCEILKRNILLLKDARNRLLPKLTSGEIEI